MSDAKKGVVEIGSRFGRLSVTSPRFWGLSPRGKAGWMVNVHCDCGTDKAVALDSLLYGNCRSCGCSRVKNVVRPGDRFNRLTAVSEIFPHPKTPGVYCAVFRCDCGTEKAIGIREVKTGHTRSCGCLRDEVAAETCWKHGLSDTKLSRIYSSMKSRCYNEKSQYYHRYGGRGIGVCPEWLASFPSFYEWAMNNGYKDGLSLDRRDNDGSYEPANCRWVDQKTQCNNMSRNRLLTIDGETKTVTQWAESGRCAVEPLAFSNRIQRGWDPKQALVTPSMSRNGDVSGKLVEAFGETKTLAEWELDPRCKAAYRLISTRITSWGWDAERAIATPSRKGRSSKVLEVEQPGEVLRSD